MRTLIAYATKHGSTAEIAERIGITLRSAGHEVDVLPIAAVTDRIEFEAVVLGSAVYMGRWMKEAATFVRLHHSLLAERPLWLFSSGPVGPKALPEAADIAEFRQLLEIRDHRTFDGALDAKKLSLAERITVKAVKAPYGDYRNWEDIDTWATSIANSLQPSVRDRQGVAAAWR
ncbi:MAG TPA: flavodoxin domain-containing protein [Clostridia bacterium]|nr:flavodoxin domain-containing protein [Clostridia bacterium]